MLDALNQPENQMDRARWGGCASKQEYAQTLQTKAHLLREKSVSFLLSPTPHSISSHQGHHWSTLSSKKNEHPVRVYCWLWTSSCFELELPRERIVLSRGESLSTSSTSYLSLDLQRCSDVRREKPVILLNSPSLSSYFRSSELVGALEACMKQNQLDLDEIRCLFRHSLILCSHTALFGQEECQFVFERVNQCMNHHVTDVSGFSNPVIENFRHWWPSWTKRGNGR